MRRKSISLFLTILWLAANTGSAVFAAPERDAAEDLLAQMSPEERVGQLMLVSFSGDSISPDDPIWDLVTNRNISGVILESKDGNFGSGDEDGAAVQELIRSLQDARYQASLLSAVDVAGQGESGKVYIPLFIATKDLGGGTMHDDTIPGLSEIPSEMAVGATWDIEAAQRVGEMIGAELEALGFNMFIGPSLDVLEEPRIAVSGDVGVRAFGGDPYWVGVLGRAYIEGLHQGSQGRIAVVAKHFPGLGSSDRPIEEEVATVRKTLEQLRQIELAPFFEVTSQPPGEDIGIADGLLSSHIRYQGLRGNIRDTTRPISLDSQAFAQVMELEPLSTWRAGGGVAVSDSLGSRAIRRFKDPREQTFPAHLVARDALLAGNDLLLLTDFAAPDQPDAYNTILATIDFFTSKYLEDPLFAQRVDESALRVLRLKLRLYQGAFTISKVQNAAKGFKDFDSYQDVANDIALRGATLISPDREELEDRIGSAPRFGDRIVFFTDVRYHRACPTCALEPVMAVDDLEGAVLRLYGPASAGQVGAWNLRSFSFADLANYLGLRPPNTPETPLVPSDEMDDPIRNADWLIFSTFDSREDAYGANALRLLLDQRPDLARSKKIVVFSFDVPYILDATDISKIDVYYGLYSGGRSFTDMAARLLFLETPASGASPVNVDGIGYRLLEVTSPDPDQIIRLAVAQAEEGRGDAGISVGDAIGVIAGPILDGNGHSVPDGTVVVFNITQQGEGAQPFSLKSTTVDGVASITFQVERTGLLSITAESDPARISETLQINVQTNAPAQATVISPTRIPTQTPAPSSTAPASTLTPTPSSSSAVSGNLNSGMMDALALLLGLGSAALFGGAGYALAGREKTGGRHALRCGLIPFIAAMGGYNYVMLGLPGSEGIAAMLSFAAGMIAAIIAGGVGLVGVVLWCYRDRLLSRRM